MNGAQSSKEEELAEIIFGIGWILCPEALAIITLHINLTTLGSCIFSSFSLVIKQVATLDGISEKSHINARLSTLN